MITLYAAGRVTFDSRYGHSDTVYVRAGEMPETGSGTARGPLQPKTWVEKYTKGE
jgi:hypothetical protein